MTIYTKFKFIGLIYSTSKNLELFFNMLLEVPIKCRNLQEQVRKMQFSINTTIFPKDGYKTKRKRKCLSMYIKYDIDCTFMGKKVKLRARNSNKICEIEVLKLTPFDELCQLLIFSGQRINLVIFETRDFFVQSQEDRSHQAYHK